MVLEKYGFKIDLQTIKKHAKTEWYKGKIWGKESEIGLTTPDYLQLAMNNLGIKSEIKRGSVDQLKYYVDQKRPPVVLVRSGKNLWHYVVVIGYTEKTMIVADPSGGRREIMSNKIFINSWNYSTDMSGKEISKKCEICNGTGKISFLPNPFGKCDSCGGTGRLSDLWLNLYLLSGYSNNMMIIPKKSFGD
jgi:ABC-type bacteriocin/lantibiotic exporter with double-glycine peptidase domain